MEWIDINIELPKADTPVLCQRVETSMGGAKYITPVVSYLKNNGRFACEFDWITVTHWMVLPEPPKNQI